MIAPPQVQAQSFARAILTDMSSILFLAGLNKAVSQYSWRGVAQPQMQILGVGGKPINHLAPGISHVLGASCNFRPITEQGWERGEGWSAAYLGPGRARWSGVADDLRRFAAPAGGSAGAEMSLGSVSHRENFSTPLSDLSLNLGAAIGALGREAKNQDICARAPSEGPTQGLQHPGSSGSTGVEGYGNGSQ